jgi:uncharacterized protein
VTALHVSTACRIHDLDLEEWDDLLRDEDFYLSSTWLRAAEETADGEPCLYVTVRDAAGDRLVGATVGYLLDETSPFVFCRPDVVVLGAPGNSGLSTMSLLPGLSVGGRNPSHSRIAVAPDGQSGFDPHAVLDVALGGLRDGAAELGARSVSLLYVDEGQKALRTALSRFGYQEFLGDEAAVLDLPGRDFADYEHRLSRSRRDAVRRERRKVLAGGVSLETRPLVAELVPTLLGLEAQLYAKYGTPYSPDRMTRLYTALAMTQRGQARVAVATLAGVIIGFALFFRQGQIMHARSVGFDYEAVEKMPVYFETLYYHLIEYAYQHGVRQIRYSTGLSDIKASRGCRRVSQYANVLPLRPTDGLSVP